MPSSGGGVYANVEAEVFFNVDLAAKHGEFSEKDAEYVIFTTFL